MLRRAVRKLAAKLPDVKGRDFLIRAGMKVEERFIGNAYIRTFHTGILIIFEQLESENRDHFNTCDCFKTNE